MKSLDKLSFYWIALIPISALIAGFLLFIRKNPVVVFPLQKQFALYPYSDSEQGGNSQSRVVNLRNEVQFEYKLGSGYQYPYAGMVIQKDSSALFDLSGLDHISIQMDATKGKKLSLTLATFIPGFTDSEKILTYRYLEKHLEITPEASTYTLSLDDFKTPAWWFQINKVRESELPPMDYSLTRFVNIQNCILIETGIWDQVSIKELTFYKDHSDFYFTSGISLAGFYIFLGVLIFFKKKNKNKELVIKYSPVEIKDIAVTEEEKVIKYLSSHYHIPDLVLEKIQKETGVSELKISLIIKKNSGLPFKQYLNRLRIEEAKRLLLNTDLQVSEIAYKVGYGNISHFNRVFKEYSGVSPNDFRKETFTT